MDLHYRQYSEAGPPLLILHGLFGSLGNWGWHSKQLAESFSVYGVDLRNHGDSPHSERLDYQVMAEDVRQLIERLGLDSCSIIGHSMGGKVAMQLALSYPDLLEKLVVVDIAPVAYPEGADNHMNVLAAMDAVKIDEVKSRTEAEVTLKEFIPEEAIRKFILTNLLRNGQGLFEWRINKDAIRKNYPALRAAVVGERSFDKPVLFVKGGASNYIQAEHEEAISALFPNAAVKGGLEAGHWLHAEQPQALQKLLMNFLLA